MKNNKLIGFTGPFSDINYGDYGMLINNVYDVNSENITLFTYDKKFLNTIIPKYFKNYDVNIVDVKFNDKFDDFLKLKNYKYNFIPLEMLSFVTNLEIGRASCRERV